MLDEIPLAESLQSIRGLGKITTAVLLGCAGDLTRYDHGRQLLRRARGMKKQASLFKLIGKLCRIIVGMVKHGQSYESPVCREASVA